MCRYEISLRLSNHWQLSLDEEYVARRMKPGRGKYEKPRYEPRFGCSPVLEMCEICALSQVGLRQLPDVLGINILYSPYIIQHLLSSLTIS